MTSCQTFQQRPPPSIRLKRMVSLVGFIGGVCIIVIHVLMIQDWYDQGVAFSFNRGQLSGALLMLAFWVLTSSIFIRGALNNYGRHCTGDCHNQPTVDRPDDQPKQPIMQLVHGTASSNGGQSNQRRELTT